MPTIANNKSPNAPQPTGKKEKRKFTRMKRRITSPMHRKLHSLFFVTAMEDEDNLLVNESKEQSNERRGRHTPFIHFDRDLLV